MTRPLGLREEFQVSVAQLEKIVYIEKFSFEDITDAVVAKFDEVAKEIGDAWLNQNSPMKPSQMKRFIFLIEKETKKFLSLKILYKEPELRHVPSRLIDRIWHQFIVDTRPYHKFCTEVYGEYLHHEPSRKRIVVDMGSNFAATKERLSAAYGAPPPLVWGDKAACDFQGCMSGCFD